jgi:hypothetical protein
MSRVGVGVTLALRVMAHGEVFKKRYSARIMWRILSIGRDSLLLESRRLLLEASGCKVMSANGIEDAIARCAGQHFDAVILCHTLRGEEIKTAYLRLRECVSISHFVCLHQYDDVSYDPWSFIHRVQQAASSM